MKTYSLKFETFLPISIETAWEFFSSPLNLSKITPPDMRFTVTSDYNKEVKMYPGMIITYKVSPALGIKLNWMTEITHVKELAYFVDEQRFGPYALWHHEHHFKVVDGGVLMNDRLNYAIPYGLIGRMANSLFIAKKIKSIFSYREEAIIHLFGEKSK